MENGEHATFIIYAGKRWKLVIRSFKPQVQQNYMTYIDSFLDCAPQPWDALTVQVCYVELPTETTAKWQGQHN